MSEALVERLRHWLFCNEFTHQHKEDLREAADRIEAAEADKARLSEALRAIVARSHNDPLGTSKVNDMRNIATAALSGSGSAWLAMDSAPKDGTAILGVSNGFRFVCHWNADRDCWWGEGYPQSPRHWRPLPAAPQQGGV